MEQINVIEENPSVIRKITAYVVQVDEKWMQLKSEELHWDDIIKISAAVATGYFPRQTTTNTKLLSEFQVGDKIMMDVRPDTGHYVPYHLHAMQFIRADGTRLIADGLIIGLSEDGAVIRNSCLQDFKFPYARIVPSETSVHVGMTVTFEVLVIDDQPRGLNMSVIADDETSVKFPVYRGRGIVRFDNDVPYVQIKGSDGTTAQYLINEWAIYGCGIPTMNLEGKTIDCTVCPNKPCFNDSFLEVVYFELSPESTVPLEERRETSVDSQTSFPEDQYNRILNEENRQTLREFFLYIIEHADAVSFERMTRQYPHFTATMVEEFGLNEDRFANMNPGLATSYQEFLRGMAALDLGTNEFRLADGDQISIQEAAQRLPTAPSFSPDAAFRREDGTEEEAVEELEEEAVEEFEEAAVEELEEEAEEEFEEAAAALPILSNRQPPIRSEEMFDNSMPVSDRSGGGNASMGSQNIDDSFSSESRPMVIRVGPGGRGRPIERLNTSGSCIELVGPTRIDVGTEGEGGDQRAQAVSWRSVAGGASGRIGKIKPG